MPPAEEKREVPLATLLLILLFLLLLPSCWVHIIFHIFFSDTPLATVAVAKGAAGSRTSICKDNAPLSNCQEDRGPRTKDRGLCTVRST